MEPRFLGAAETRLARDRLDDRDQAAAPCSWGGGFQILSNRRITNLRDWLEIWNRWDSLHYLDSRSSATAARIR